MCLFLLSVANPNSHRCFSQAKGVELGTGWIGQGRAGNLELLLWAVPRDVPTAHHYIPLQN